MANSEINRKTLLTGIIDINSKSEISIFQMQSLPCLYAQDSQALTGLRRHWYGDV